MEDVDKIEDRVEDGEKNLIMISANIGFPMKIG